MLVRIGVTNLGGSLVELLGVEGSANTQGDTGPDEDVVRGGGDAAVVELELFPLSIHMHISDI